MKWPPVHQESVLKMASPYGEIIADRSMVAAAFPSTFSIAIAKCTIDATPNLAI